MNDMNTTTDDNWADGYVVDVEYVTGFQKEEAPSWMCTIATLLGHSVPNIAGKTRWAELGCGNGLTAATIAAMNPGADIWGFDFNPAAIATARSLAERLEATNARFEEASFASLAAGENTGLPMFDFIVAHGVLSWVGPEHRRDIMTFIRRQLAPGGLAFFSYNVEAGYAAMRPLSTIMRLVADIPDEQGRRRRSDHATAVSLEFLETLRAGGARYFDANPSVVHEMARLRAQDPRYVAHEHLNAVWHPMPFSEVDSLAEEAGLSYVGSADPADNLDDATFPPALLPLAGTISTRRLKEGARDIACSRAFRRDIYIKRPTRDRTPTREPTIDTIKLAGVGVPGSQAMQVNGPLGPLSGDPSIYGPVLERLLQGPATLGEIAELPELEGRPAAEIGRLAAIHLASGMAQPLLPNGSEIADSGRVRRLNAEIARVNAAGGSLTMLATANGGTCTGAAQGETLIAGALAALPGMNTGSAAEIGILSKHATLAVQRAGGVMMHGNEQMNDLPAIENTIRALAARMLNGRRRKALEDLGSLGVRPSAE
jgi:SAM-dependent methyltransferase